MIHEVTRWRVVAAARLPDQRYVSVSAQTVKRTQKRYTKFARYILGHRLQAISSWQMSHACGMMCRARQIMVLIRIFAATAAIALEEKNYISALDVS